MSPCTTFLYTRITFSGRIFSSVSACRLVIASRPSTVVLSTPSESDSKKRLGSCRSSSSGRNAPAYARSTGMLLRAESSCMHSFNALSTRMACCRERARASKLRYTELRPGSASAYTSRTAHLRYDIGMPARQLELAGLVELPGLLQVLDELEQPRSTCHKDSGHSPPFSLVLVCQALALVGGRRLAMPTEEPSSNVCVGGHSTLLVATAFWDAPAHGTATARA